MRKGMKSLIFQGFAASNSISYFKKVKKPKKGYEFGPVFLQLSGLSWSCNPRSASHAGNLDVSMMNIRVQSVSPNSVV